MRFMDCALDYLNKCSDELGVDGPHDTVAHLTTTDSQLLAVAKHRLKHVDGNALNLSLFVYI